MEERESSERKSLLIKTILIIILLLLSFLATILYVYLYPKTTVNLYKDDPSHPYSSFTIKRYSTLSSLPGIEKTGYTFLYWTYDDWNGERFDLNKELDSEVINLYANYTANQCVINYYVQMYSEVDGYYDTIIKTEPILYGDSYTVWNPVDRNGNLLPDFPVMNGFHFAGWTLEKMVDENDTNLSGKLYEPNTERFYTQPSETMNLHAFYMKNRYSINLHTGIKYEMNGGVPARDENNEYIIKNSDNEVIKDQVIFQQSLGDIAEAHKNMELNVDNYGDEASEYEFLGWYLDPEYKVSIDSHELILQVERTTGIPYYEYEINGEKIKSYAKVIGTKEDGSDDYGFDIYSKWQRKCYEITLNKNSNRSTGKLEPIYLYKVNFDKNGNALGFGAYYNDGNSATNTYFTYEGYANGGHYSKVNLEYRETMGSTNVVGNDFVTSVKDSSGRQTYRLIGWTDSINTKNEGTNWYSKWQQVAWSKEYVESGTEQKLRTGAISYGNSVYSQTLSEDVTLYAQWSQLFDIKFAYASGSNQDNFVWSGIEGEWFVLPNMTDIINRPNGNGQPWTKQYNNFAGWTTGTSSLATKYYERINGELNPEYIYTIGRTSATLIVLWQKTPYKVSFYKNDGTNDIHTFYEPVYGGTFRYYPGAPTRAGYLFTGWSQTKFADGQYARLRRESKDNGTTITSDKMAYTSSSNFHITGNMAFYASWTPDYMIEYNANGGTFSSSSKTLYRYSEIVSSSKSQLNLKANIYVGNRIALTREGYDFKGWQVKCADETYATIKSSSTTRTTFDFYDNKFYSYRAEGVMVDENNKTQFVMTDNTVTLQALWEAKKFKITIIDTRANGTNSNTRVDIVRYDDLYTFPIEDSLGVNYNTKIGYKLVGFSTSRDGTGTRYDVTYVDGSPVMPTIGDEETKIKSNLTFYTIYEQKDITLEYYLPKEDGEPIGFRPTATNVTAPGIISYGQTLVLPTVTSADVTSAGINSKYKFKYWYYVDNGVEKVVKSGDSALFHDENDKLKLYAKLEVESYYVSLSITNPFKDSNYIVETIDVGSFEKNVQIGEEKYNQVMYKLYDRLSKILSDYVLRIEKTTLTDADGNEYEVISKVIFKGYYLDGLFTRTATPVEFNKDTILTGTSNNIVIVTKWGANTVNLVYKSGEEEGAQTKNFSENYSSEIKFQSNTLFTLEGGLQIKSWYIKSTNETLSPLYFEADSYLTGQNGKYPNLDTLSANGYITWIDSGVGTITIYANTQQICEVTYYTYDGSATPSEATTLKQTFPLGELPSLRSGVNYGDMVFEGWYYKGKKVTSIPVSNSNPNVSLYANYTYKYSVKNVSIIDNIISFPELKKYSKTLDLLGVEKNAETGQYICKNYDSATDKYTYTNQISLTAPTSEDITIPTGYNYHGIKFMNENKIYSLADVNAGITKSVDGTNFEIQTYFTKTYTLKYRLDTSDNQTFGDDTTDDKVETYQVGYDNVAVDNSTINFIAKKPAHTFVGWKILLADGTLSEKTYVLGESITLSTVETVLKPVFGAPATGTIEVIIQLIKSSTESDVYKSKTIHNGETYTFDGSKDDIGNRVSNEWVSGAHDLYRWKANSTAKSYLNKEYFEIGDSFTVPTAIQEDIIFSFTGEWVKKYIIDFTQDAEHVLAEYTTKSVTLQEGVEFTLKETPTIPTPGITFEYWLVTIGGKEIEIRVGDKIVVTTNSTYTFDSTLTNVTHYFPMLNGLENTYTLVGSWTSVKYDVTLNIVDPLDPNTTLHTLKLVDVPYGTTIGNREMLDSSFKYLDEASKGLISTILGMENDSRGIRCWKDKDGNVVVLQNISGNLELYAVWENKYSVEYVAESTDTEFGYSQTMPTTYHLPGDKITFNNVLSSIYRKGYMTVYFADGKYNVIPGTGKDYYQLTKFGITNKDTGVLLDTLEIREDNSFLSFEINANIIITPIFESISKVTFKDNTTDGGGQVVLQDSQEKYVVFVKTGKTLELKDFNTSRTGFAFVGWNEDKTSETTQDKVTGNGSEITVYAVWASTRKAQFVLQIQYVGGLNSVTLFELPLTKLNKINKTTLQNYLDDSSKNGNFLKIANLQDLGHPAYIYNGQRFYLDGFNVTDNTNNKTHYSLIELCNIDFGASNFNTSENVTVMLNTYDIFSITYINSYDATSGINEVDYFVSNEKNSGKLVAGTKFETLTLPNQLTNPTVTRPNYSPAYWSSSSSEYTQNSASKYYFNNASSLTLTPSQLKTISRSLREKNSQNYNLYLMWEYKNINVKLNLIATLKDTADINDQNETVLTDPYLGYSKSTDGSGIKFVNVPNFIHIYSNNVLVRMFNQNNYDFNKADSPITAQVKYNSSIYLSAKFNENFTRNTSVGGYTLVGFTKSLYKLGETCESSKIYRLNRNITINDDILTYGELILYPYYELESARMIYVYAENGTAQVQISNSPVSGFVQAPSDNDKNEEISYNDYIVNRFSQIVITANKPDSGYVFKEFHKDDTFNATIEDNVLSLDCKQFFDGTQENGLRFVEIHYEPIEVKVTMNLGYKYYLKSDGDEGSINFSGNDKNGTAINLTINYGHTSNSEEPIIFASNSGFKYTINNTDSYYNYQFYLDSGHTRPLESADGKTILVSDLDITYGTENTATLYVLATPKTYTVSFNINKGTLTQSSKLRATTNTLFADCNDVSFDVAVGTANVYVGSILDLPTKETIKDNPMNLSYPNVVFLGFYVQGDQSREIKIEYTVTSNTIFNELYSDSVVIMQYNYLGRTTMVSYQAGSEVIVGDGVDQSAFDIAYEFMHWTHGSNTYNFGDKITIQNSMILEGVFQGKDITFKYSYNTGSDQTTYDDTSKYGQDYVLISEEDNKLTNLKTDPTKYIYGWKYTYSVGEEPRDITFKAGTTIPFASWLGFEYSETNKTIVLNAVYFNKYQYQIEYDVTNVSNAGNFSSQNYVVRSNSEQDLSFADELLFKINSVQPQNSNEHLIFTQYSVKVSTDGGSNFVDDTTNLNLVAGGKLKLLSPTQSNLGTTIVYKLTPNFESNVGSLPVTFDITNPVDNSSLSNNTLVGDTKTLSKINTFTFYTNTLFTDDYLPKITTSAGNNIANFEIQKQSLTFGLQLDIDWFAYGLVGYMASVYSDDTNFTLKEFRFGVEGDERNLKGVHKLQLSPIWEKKYVINYFNESNIEVTELRQYIDYSSDLTKLSTHGNISPSDLSGSHQVSDFLKENHEWIGYTNIANDHVITSLNSDTTRAVVLFENNEISCAYATNRVINLYPAQALKYKVKFATYLLGETTQDLSEFTMADKYASGTDLSIYLGSTITLPDLDTLYTSRNKTKYEFVGFTDKQNSDAYIKTEYEFNINNANNDGTITLFANFQRKAINVIFSFSGVNAKGFEKLGNYTLELQKQYGDQIDLSYSYNEDGTYTFVNNNSLSSSDDSLQNVVNQIVKDFDYFKLSKIWVGNSALDTNYTLTLTETIDIKLEFEPIYRLQYNMYGNADKIYYDDPLEGKIYPNEKGLLGEQIIEKGITYSAKYNIDKIVIPGVVLSCWSYDGKNDFFDKNGHTTINAFTKSNMTDDYRIALWIKYETNYTVNIHYFNSFEEMKKGEYSKVISVDTVFGQSFEMNLSSIFDSKIEEMNKNDATKIKIGDTVINNLNELSKVFENKKYTHNGLVNVALNKTERKTYSISQYVAGITGVGDIYSVKTYSKTTPFVNDLYLVYSPMKFTITLNTMVGDVNAENKFVYDKNLVSQSQSVKAEYALEQENNGEIAEDKRVIVEGGWTSKEYLDITNTIYLINSNYFKADTNKYLSKYYDFVGWKIRIATTDETTNTTTYSFKELTENGTGLSVTIDGQNRYQGVTGFVSDINLVACFVPKKITAEVTVKSVDNLGDELKLKFTDKSSKVEISAQESVDSANHVTKYTMQVVQNSKITIESQNETYGISLVSYSGNNFGYGNPLNADINIPTASADDDGVFRIIVTLDYHDTKIVYFNLENNNGNVGKLSKVNFNLNGHQLSTTNITLANESVGGIHFATQVALPKNAVITTNFAEVALNNYTLTSWDMYDEATRKFQTLNSSIEVTSDIYLKAKYEAKEITIEYVIDNNGSKTTLSGIADKYSKGTYGSQITLPYIIVEMGSRVTTGFARDGLACKFGETITISSKNNAELNGKLTLEVTTIEFYYIRFTKGDTTFELPTVYPQQDNSVKVKIAEQEIRIKAGISYYYKSLDSIQNPITNMETLDTGYLMPNTYTIPIPTHEISSSDNVTFIGWKTKSNKVCENGDTYECNSNDAENGIITFNAINSNVIKVEFYITNPVDKTELKLTTNTNKEPSLTEINILVDKEENSVLVDYIGADENHTQFNVKYTNGETKSTSYFVKSKISEKYLGRDYKFYGWSTESKTSFSDISQFISDSNAVSYYGSNFAKLSDTDIAQKLQNAIKTSKKFYAVWENKFSVEFVDNRGDESNAGTVVSKQYYGKGEQIEFPEQKSIENTSDNRKITGWKSGSYEINYPNPSLSVVNGSNENLKFVPIWSQGYQLTFNMGFDDKKTLIQEIFKSYASEADAGNISTGLGYPYFEDLSQVSGSGSSATINGKTYYSSYTLNDYLTENQTINLNDFKPVDTGIYPSNINLINNATWLNNYYTFDGWKLNGKAIEEKDFANFQISANTELVAKWKAITFDVDFYANKDHAQSGQKDLIKHTLKYNFEDLILVPSETHGTAIKKNGEVVFGDDAQQLKQLFPNSGFRQNGWECIDGTITDRDIRIINNLRIVPTYETEYIIVFKNIRGNELTSIPRQYVINGENIAFDKTQLAQMKVSKMYYYQGSSDDTKVDLFTRPENTEDYSTLPTELAFDKNNFRIEKVGEYYYGYIYLDISLSLTINVPNANFGKANENEWTSTIVAITPESTYEFDGNKITLGGKEVFSFDMSGYTNSPELLGWFYYESNQGANGWYNYLTNPRIPNAYLLDDLDYAIKSFSIKIDGGKVNINIVTKTKTYELTNVDASINVFAKLATKNIIKLQNADACDFAKLEYTKSSYSQVNMYGKSSSDILGFEFKTVYNSCNYTNFSLRTVGYQLKDIENINGFESSNKAIVNNIALNNNDGERITLKAEISKSTSTEIQDLLLNYNISLGYCIENNKTYVLKINPITYSVTYVTDSSSGSIKKLTYPYDFDETKNNAENKDSVSMQTTDYLYIDGQKTNLADLHYYVETSGTQTKVIFVDVPYGANINIVVEPNNDMLMHFVGFNKSTNKGITENGAVLTFRPYEVDEQENNIITNIVVNVLFETNTIDSIELALDFDTKLIGNSGAWFDAINNYNQKTSKTYAENGNTYTNYQIKWKNISGVTAGEDVTELLASLKADYHQEFDQKLPVSQTVEGSIQDLDKLLQYFWMSDKDNWFTETKTFDNYNSNSDGLLVQNDTTKAYNLYGADGKTVRLHYNMTKAVLANFDTSTIDYVDHSTSYNVSRAKVSLVDNSPNTLDQVNKYVFNYTNPGYEYLSDYVDGKEYQKLSVKFQLGSNIQFKVIPDDATSEHVKYTFSQDDWKILNRRGTDAIPNDFTRTDECVHIDSGKSNIDDMFVTFGQEGNLPLINLRASVRPTTYYVNFLNDNDSQIGKIEIAYDAGIDEVHYMYNLQSLYNSTVHSMYKFLDDGYPPKCNFRSSVDTKDTYGELTKIFKFWSTSKGGVEQNPNDIILHNSDFSNIDLYANYVDATPIRFVKFDEDGNKDTYTLYLAPIDFENSTSESFWPYEDQFSRTYGFSVVMDELDSLSDFLGNAYEVYLKGKDNKSNIYVNFINHLCDADKEDSEQYEKSTGTYIVYPVYTRSLRIGTHYTDKPKDVSDFTLTLSTLGGKYELSMSDSGNLVITNVLEHCLRIATKTNFLSEDEDRDNLEIQPYTGYPDYRFAMWMIDGNNVNSENHIAGNQLTTNDKFLRYQDTTAYPHYNAMFSVTQPDQGKRIIIDSNNNPSETSAYFPFINKLMSQEYIQESDGYKIEYTSLETVDGKVTSTLIVYKGSKDNKVYTITFTPDRSDLNKVVWKVADANGRETILALNSIYSVLDANGSLVITPIAYTDINLEVEGFYITNRPEKSNEIGNINTNPTNTSKVSGGYKFKGFTATSLSSAELIVIDLDGNETTTKISISPSPEAQENEKYLRNIRFQYKENGEWKDINENTIVNRSSSDTVSGGYVMNIRLVADWISSKVNLTRLADNSDVKTTKIWDLTQARNYKEYSFKPSDSDETNKLNFELFKGQTLEFNEDLMQFVIKEDGQTVRTIQINRGSDAYVQGIFELNSSSYIDERVISSKTFTGGKDDANLLVWIENQVEVSVNVQEASDKVPGYGIVKYQTQDFGKIKSSEVAFSRENKVYGTLTVGISTKLSLSASADTNANHEFQHFVYSKNTYVLVQDVIVSKFGVSENKTTIGVLFDAEPTKSDVHIARMEDSLGSPVKSITVYGGYVVIRSGISTNDVAYEIKDYWGNQVSAFTIHKVDDISTIETDIYPSMNCYISAINTVVVKGKVTLNNDGKITNSLENGEPIDEQTLYNGNKSSIIDVLVEGVDKSTINFVVYSNDINNTKTTSIGLSANTVYIDQDGTPFVENSKTLKVSSDNNKATLKYSANKIDISLPDDPNNFAGLIKCGKAGYELTSAVVYKTNSYTNDANKVAKCLSGQDDEFDVLETVYTIVITITQKDSYYISLKLTLPNGSDFRNLNVQVSKGLENRVEDLYNATGFNGGISVSNNELTFGAVEGGENVIGFKLAHGTTVKSEVKGSTYTVVFTNKAGTETTKISFTLPNIYTLYNDSYAWYMDYSDNHLKFTSEQKTIGDYSYNLWSFDKTNPVTAEAQELENDGTLVLALDRAEVKIHVNGAYWESVNGDGDVSFIKTQEDEERFIYSASKYNEWKQGDITYKFPGGLIKLDLQKLSYGSFETAYSIIKAGINTQYSLNVPNTIGNIRMNEIPSQGYGLSIMVDGKTSKTIYAVSYDMADELSNGFAILSCNNNSNTLNSFVDVELTRDNEWVVIDLPFGDTDRTVGVGHAGREQSYKKAKYTTVTFYDKPYGTSGTSSIGTFNTSPKIWLDVPSTPMQVKTQTMYIAKDKWTRLYGDILASNKPDTTKYRVASLQFDAGSIFDDIKNDAQTCILSGYYISMGANTKTIEKSELVDFGEYENVSIYPVFKAATGYTVTIRSINNLTNIEFTGWLPELGPLGELGTTPNSDLLSHEDIVRFVEKGQKFEWSTALVKQTTLSLVDNYSLQITCRNPNNYEEKPFGFNGFSIYDKNMTWLGNALYINEDESNYEYQTLTFGASSGNSPTEWNKYSCGVTQSDTYDLEFTPLKDLILVPQHFSVPTVEVEYICDGLSSDWTLKVISISGWYAGRTETKIVKYYEKDSAGPTLDSKDSPYFTYDQVSSIADDISQTTYTTHFVWKHTEHDMGTLYEGCKYCSFTYNTSGGSDGTGGSTHTCSESGWEYDESEHFKRKCVNVNCSNYNIKINKGPHNYTCAFNKVQNKCIMTCSVCGRTGDCTCEDCDCTGDKHEHLFTNWKDNRNGTHTGTCKCGDTKTETHNINYSSAISDGEHAGYHYYGCRDCDYKNYLGREKCVAGQPTVAHDYGCGRSMIQECEICGRTLKSYIENVYYNEHIWGYTPYYESNPVLGTVCTSHRYACKICGYKNPVSDTESHVWETDSSGEHVFEKIKKDSSDPNEYCYIEEWWHKCTKCGYKEITQVVEPKHNIKVVGHRTETEDGERHHYEYSECSICEAISTRNIREITVIPRLNDYGFPESHSKCMWKEENSYNYCYYNSRNGYIWSGGWGKSW